MPPDLRLTFGASIDWCGAAIDVLHHKWQAKQVDNQEVCIERRRRQNDKITHP